MSIDLENTPLIEVKELTKKFHKLTALDSVSINIYEGDVVFVVGPSGSGKSTFLRCLNRLEESTGGSILFEGVNITDDKKLTEKLKALTSIDVNELDNISTEDMLSLADIIESTYDELRSR